MCGILAAVTVLYFVVPLDRHVVGGVVLRSAGACLLLALLAGAVVAQLRLSTRHGDERVDGLILAIALVWFVFALGFYGLHERRPDEVAGLETRLDALYFVTSTMLTVGYGDIHATGQVARGLVLAQMLFDVVFVATAGAMISARVRDKAARRAAERRYPASTPEGP